MAAKVYDEHEKEHFAEVVQPALDDPDLDIEFLGEVDARRDPLLAGALATVMLGAWPEPFGSLPSNPWPPARRLRAAPAA